MRFVPRCWAQCLPDVSAYGGHSVYLFSTLDDPTEVSLKTRTPSPVLLPNSKQQKTGDNSPSTGPDNPTGRDSPHTTDGHVLSDHEDVQMDESGDRGDGDDDDDDEEDEGEDAETKYSEVPMILPRRSFKGISNLRTIKDGTAFLAWQGILVADGRVLCSQLCRTKRRVCRLWF